MWIFYYTAGAVLLWLVLLRLVLLLVDRRVAGVAVG